MLLQYARSAGQEELPVCGEIFSLSKEGWVLSPGAWIRVALPQDNDAHRLEIRASGRTLQVVDRENWNILIDEKIGGISETSFQFDPSFDLPSQITQIEVYLVTSSDERILNARSCLGVILPQTDLPCGFYLHSVDNRCFPASVDLATAERAKSILRALQERGEKIILDLGCGFRKTGNIGIDATLQNTDADLICLLGFDQLPFEDSTVDEVVCRDFLEHIPKAVYLESKGRLHYPIMQLMDEIWRVLKPGGIFRSWTPMYPNPEVFQDPTHLSSWTIKSMDYFCGIYEGAKRIYGIQACFEKIDIREEGFYLFAELRKPKGTVEGRQQG
jgi:SAM-dependent methyltransferase